MKYIWILFFNVLLISCSAEVSDFPANQEPMPANSVLTGVFVDAPVEGLTYTSSPSGRTGTTNVNGEFEYISGDTVSFAMANIDLGTATPNENKKVTVTQLPKGIQVAQLLQTLDNNVDENSIDISGIVIPQPVITTIKSKLNNINDNDDILSVEDLNAIKSANVSKHVLMAKTKIVSKAEAIAHVTKQTAQQGLYFKLSELSNATFIESSLLFNKAGSIYAFDNNPENTFKLIDVNADGSYYSGSEAQANSFRIKGNGDLELTFSASNPTAKQGICTVIKLAESDVGLELMYTCIKNGKVSTTQRSLHHLVNIQTLKTTDLNGRSYTLEPLGGAESITMSFNDGKYTTSINCEDCRYQAGKLQNSVTITTDNEQINFLLAQGTLDKGKLVVTTYDQESNVKKVEVIDINGSTLTVLHSANKNGNRTDTGTTGSGTTEPDTSLIWQPNVFADASIYKNHCAAPRTDTDINGNAYPDVQGSSAHEKFWLRSWSNNTYLWYNEVADQDPNDSRTPQEYFDTLKTNLLSSTGQPKDKYHFISDTETLEQVAQAGVRFSYGMYIGLQQSRPPRKGTVAYVIEGSPAANAGMARGDTLVEINGEDFVSGDDIDKLNAGYLPTKTNPTHTFKLKRINGKEYSIRLTAQDLSEPPVLLSKTYTHTDTNQTKFGYVALNTFGTYKAEEAIYNAFAGFVSDQQVTNDNIDELVVDLRYNGGGYVFIASQLSYAIAGSNIPDNGFFSKPTFNDKHPTHDPVTGNLIQNTPFLYITYKNTDTIPKDSRIPTLNLKRVFILSTGRTCSASESVINALSGIDVEVVLIGAATCGKPYGFYSTDNCSTTYSTIQVKSSNSKGFGDYSDGFIPSTVSNPAPPYIKGCVIEDDFTQPLGNVNEALFNAAVNYDAVGCPAAASFLSDMPSPDFFGRDLFEDPRMRQHEIQKSSAMYLGTPFTENSP